MDPAPIGEIYYVEPAPDAPRSMALIWVSWIQNIAGQSGNLRLLIFDKGVEIDSMYCPQSVWGNDYWVLGCFDLSIGVTSFVKIDQHTNVTPTRAAYGCV